ncbi:hypothetical protein PVK06_048264 [Gossypium arboreum]|uniref:TonB-dependent receptor n=1 Tax=Gossypium arboreum TaxID=29729 RepID=A0ABR0MFZ3_GOSAR|nr:hypothetical protein PVK06_048264 [Gossypium arboreum]
MKYDSIYYRNTIKFYSAYGFVFRAQFEMSVDYNVDVDQEMYTGYDVSNELDGTESATPSVNIISTQQPNVK